MKTKDTLWMGLRSLFERPLETGLLVIGIALASCVAAASFLLQGSQRIQTEALLQGPAYREIIVRSASGGEPGSETQSLREVTQESGPSAQIGDKDLANVLDTIPAIAYGYRYNNETLRTGTFGGPGGFGGGPQVVTATQTQTAGQSGTAAGGADGAGTGTASSAQVQAQGGNAGQDGNAGAAGGTGAAAGSAGPEGSEASAVDGAGPEGSANPEGGPGGFPGDPFGGQDTTTLAEGEVLLETDTESFRSLEATADFFVAYGIEAGHGNLFTDSDTTNQSTLIVLGGNLADRLFPGVDPATLVGGKIRLNNRIYTVAGILAAASDTIELANGSVLGDLAITPSFQFTIQAGGQTIVFNRGGSTLRFSVADTSDLDEAVASLKDYFTTTYGEDKVTFTIPWEEARLSRSGFDRLLWIIVAFGTGAFLMALINLMNMMLTRALRRQAAMGILAAMGAKQTDLLWLQAVEGGAMSLAGSLLGLVLAIPLYGVLHAAGTNLFGIGSGAAAPLDAGVFLLTAPVLIAVALVMALIPAFQGSRLSITNALRAE